MKTRDRVTRKQKLLYHGYVELDRPKTAGGYAGTFITQEERAKAKKLEKLSKQVSKALNNTSNDSIKFDF